MGVIRDLERNEPMIPIARGSTYVAFRAGVPEGEWGGAQREPAVARAATA